MKQLELALTGIPSREKQLERHMLMFRANFTYDELQEWHKRYTLLKYRIKGDFIERDV